MKTSYVKISFIVISAYFFSSAAIARHAVDTNITIERDSTNAIRLSHIQLRHDNDGNYRLSGEVRRRQNLSLSFGHFDLTVFDEGGGVVFEDAEYYWPRVVNRRYNHPSKFVFSIPENIANQTELRLGFHKDTLAERPKPIH